MNESSVGESFDLMIPRINAFEEAWAMPITGSRYEVHGIAEYNLRLIQVMLSARGDTLTLQEKEVSASTGCKS